MPLLKFKQALARADIGACVSLLATDAGAARDLPAYARLSGHELIQQTVDEAGVLKFVIRKHG
jgi:tRNA 2-thiouridine synthesizing protein A